MQVLLLVAVTFRCPLCDDNLETGSIAKVKEIACLPRQNIYIFKSISDSHSAYKVSWIQLVLKMNVDTKYFHKYRYFNTIINVYSSII